MTSRAGPQPASATRCRIDAALSPARQSGVREKRVVPYWMRSVTAPPLVGRDTWVTADTYFCCSSEEVNGRQTYQS